jgi:L-ascorbate metabolism protein UlaG (beta-lactamase superfamily)
VWPRANPSRCPWTSWTGDSIFLNGKHLERAFDDTAVYAERIACCCNDTIARNHDPAIAAEGYDWDNRMNIGSGAAATLVPARHWSARNLSDRNMSLWASFVIETPGGRIYAVGGSAYGNGQHFRDARQRYGPLRLAILPIGAYEPRWFMRDQHMNPAEAVQEFIDCAA